jgi:hypothetical protein
LSTHDDTTWQDLAKALGPPVYRAAGKVPRESFGAHGDPPVSVDLSFGDWGALLVVETSVEPVDDRRMLSLMIMNVEPTYPLTITEENVTVIVDGHATAFRMLRLEDDVWAAVAAVGDRWVLVRGIGVPAEGIAIEQVEVE